MTARRHYDVVLYAPMLAPLLATNDAGSTGGAETQLLLVARMLAARGLRVCLATYDVPGATIPASVDGVDVALRPPKRRRGTARRVRELVGLIRQLVALDAEVYVSRIASYHVGPVAIAARLRRRRFVYSSAHVTDFDVGQVAMRPKDRILFSIGLALAQTIVVQTEEQAALCRMKLGREAVLIPNVVERAQPRAGAGEAFLWVGRAVWYKAPLAFVELARAVPEARFRAVLLPVPEDPDLPDGVREAAAGRANLEILGPRPRRELTALYRDAVAVVNTSRFEGMSNVTLEGWAHGVPALTLAHDPDGLIATHGLGEFADGDWAAFVAAARRLWATRGDAAELSAHCRAHVERFSEAAVAPRWIEALGLAALMPASARVEAA